MKKIYLLLLVFVIRLSATAQNPYWQQEVHYTIDVSLNDTEHTLEGFLKLRYINHSPDTLHFIWFHLWPNAFKNDRTAFTEQTLQNGRTDFYFSPREKRGYINRLDFRTGNTTLKTEDHPEYIDIIKVNLAAPLLPGQETELTTPFHVQLPANFSRGGHTGHSYQVTQWYPKPAVYDRSGWHEMPYLDQGEFYSEFGSFDVSITVPDQYVVAATGELQNEAEKKWLKGKAEMGPMQKAVMKKKLNAQKHPYKKPVAHKPAVKKRTLSDYAKAPVTKVRPVQTFKTLQYKQDNIHDFAWFADSSFIVKQDTIQLSSGRVVQAMSFYRSPKSKGWAQSIQYIKDAVHFRSNLIGEYPYNTVSVVEAKIGFEGGMEYPTITSISPGMDEKELDMTIEHEVGHNWFYGILGSNERDHPWMDEGVNTYYDNRYKAMKYPGPDYPKFVQDKLPATIEELPIDALAAIKKDQPIATPSADFTFLNYMVMTYLKTGVLLKHLENKVGVQRFDSCMQAYYQQWQFKHPQPQDFQKSFSVGDGKAINSFFDSLQQKGAVNAMARHKKFKPAFLFNFKNYDSINYLNWMPAIGYNAYDHFMLGLALHNYTFPSHKLQFFVSPMYATVSKQVVGIGRVGYTWRPSNTFEKINLSVGGSHFSTLDGTDSNANKIFAGFYKLSPALKVTFNNKNPRSNLEKWLEFRTYLIWEKNFRYVLKSSDASYYPTEGKTTRRYLNQLSFNIADYRALYPYDVRLQVQQGEGFYRASVTGNYFFNYTSKGEGLQMRVFAAKFGYLGEKTLAKQIATEVYQPKLTAVRGNEDYTYSNYFLGRNEQSGFFSQQIMMRDGGLKIRTDLFQGLQGRSDNWIASMNLNTTIPTPFPIKNPIKPFLDIGTYADAWKKNAETSRFLYVAGLQLSLFDGLINAYGVVWLSKEFKDALNTLPGDKRFITSPERLSFSIDIDRFNLRKATGNKIPF